MCSHTVPYRRITNLYLIGYRCLLFCDLPICNQYVTYVLPTCYPFVINMLQISDQHVTDVLPICYQYVADVQPLFSDLLSVCSRHVHVNMTELKRQII